VVGIPNQMKLYAEIVSGNMAIGNQFTVASDAMSGVNGVSGRQYGFRIMGAVVANVEFGYFILGEGRNSECCGLD
jgi:hypothetical protein